MILCPSCNTEYSENANFCSNCGAPLKSLSQKSNQAEIDLPIFNDTITKTLKRLMPTSYVEKLLASKGKMEGERRVVTILFSDVKGSTSLSEDLDPEEVLEVMNGAFNVLIEPITRYEGTIARLMGDAILAFFGAPIAHEDDPQRACKAALEIVKGANEFSTKLESEKGLKGFGVRVGINTGLVVVAEVGSDFRVEYTAMGDAVNVAARMESAAEPGTVLITESTKKLVQNDFELISIGPILVKGKSSPINTFRILESKKHSNYFPKSKRFISPLIGRETELKKIINDINQLPNGNGRIISVLGDRGIGKSRLVREVYDSKPQDIKWAEGRALSYSLNKSYWVIQELIRNYFGFYQETSDRLILESIQKKVEYHFQKKSEEVFPFFEYFLKDYSGNKKNKETKFENLRAVKGQFHFAFKEFIKKESTQNPVVLVWEDLQWCDFSSLELLYELLPLVKENPILFLLQYRLDENEKRIWDFYKNLIDKYSENHTELILHPLGDTDSVLLFDNLTKNIKLPVEIRKQLLSKSEGNPSFIEELINSITEKIEVTEHNQSLKSINLNKDLELPESLNSLIMSRFDSLDQIDKTVLQTAAVIGRVFPKKLLISLLSDTLNESEIESSLNKLQLKEFILRHLPSNISSGASIIRKEYIFKQDLTQNVIYNSLLISQRQILHKKVGIEIENLYLENIAEFLESLALHFDKSRDFAKAIKYYKCAADRAKGLFANEDAILFYSRALELTLKVDTEQMVIAQLYESMGDLFFVNANYLKSADNFNLSLNYYKNPTQKAKVYNKLGKVFERSGNYSASLENYNKALKLINRNIDTVFSAQINSGISMVYFRQGNLYEAKKLIIEVFNLLNKVDDCNVHAEVYNNMGIIYSRLGDHDKALKFHNKCLEIFEQSEVSSGLAATYNNIGYVYHQKNELDSSIKFYKKSLEYCEKTGNLHGLAKTYDNISQIYMSQGKNDLAMDFNLKAVSILGRIVNSDSEMNADVWLQSGVW